MKAPAGRDLRAYARTTQARLILGGLVILLTVGVGLIRIIYGREAAGMAAACIGVGLAPIVLVALWLALLDWAARKGRDV